MVNNLLSRKSRFINPFLRKVSWLILFLVSGYIAEATKLPDFQMKDSMITVSGVVTDTTGNPVVGASVRVKGTTNGQITNDKGEFTLEVSGSDAILIISSIGYKSRNIQLNGKTFIKVVLQTSQTSLNQVVVVGYGTQSKISVTGAIDQIQGESISDLPTTSLGNALTGRVPGLSTIQSTGQPGISNPQVFIRGVSTFNNSNPLVIIDGVPSTMNALMRLSPNSVQTISVLKDASATAVYGVRGANGIIIVTTKRGEKGPLKVSASFSGGVQVPTKFPQIADSYQWALARNQGALNDGDSSNLLDPTMVSAFKTGKYPLIYPNINWWNKIVNNYALQTKNNINFSGGSDKAQYFVSLSYLNKDGLFNTDFEGGPAKAYGFKYHRYNINANIDMDLSSSTRLSITTGVRQGKRSRPLPIAGVGEGGVNFWNKIVRHSVPFGSAGLIDGRQTTTSSLYYPLFIQQTVFSLIYGRGYQRIAQNRLNLKLELNQKLNVITKGLSFSLIGNYRSGFNEISEMDGTNTYPKYVPIFRADAPSNAVPEDSTIVFQQEGTYNPKKYGGNYQVKRYLYWQADLRYDRRFGKHHVGGLLLYNQSKDYYPGGQFPDIPHGYVSSAGRITYSYDETYFLEFDAGYNGSENFQIGRRFGFFPAVSGGWILTNENFMQKISFLDFLKVRASWGKVGNDDVGGANGRFIYIGNQYGRTNRWGGYNYGVDIPDFSDGITAISLGNSLVSWETAKKQNYGIDARFFRNRLSIHFDYFREKRDNILMYLKNVPAFLGQALSLPPVNVGKVNNHGYEVKVNWSNNSGDFSYHIGGHVSYAKNSIVYMSEVPPTEAYQTLTGHPLGTNFGFVADGFYSQEDINLMQNGKIPQNKLLGTTRPGVIKFKDLNGDEVIDNKDQKPIGYPSIPQITLGSSMGIRFKGFEINLLWQGAAQVTRLMRGSYAIPRLSSGTIFKYQINRAWTPEKAEKNQENLLPGLSFLSEKYNGLVSTLWVRNSSYLRLKSAEIGYTFSSQFLKRIGLHHLKVYVNGYDLLTFETPEFRETGLDPEKYYNNSSTNAYPLIKVFNLGINVQF